MELKCPYCKKELKNYLIEKQTLEIIEAKEKKRSRIEKEKTYWLICSNCESYIAGPGSKISVLLKELK
ncbi:MAG TPA: hypothetical protein PLK41_04525 [Defluviitoga tunisiensis]|nr:hypothetical protein [bacterium]HPP10236.1 hypothetical protein [Defluviitoga tunisiensis]